MRSRTRKSEKHPTVRRSANEQDPFARYMSFNPSPYRNRHTVMGGNRNRRTCESSSSSARDDASGAWPGATGWTPLSSGPPWW
ncbi:hypothetical protein Q1695_010881 [Nippostrongylus brasiliensis]|nr:hypothetical protein Q1695_010881 [Nippostrongylus brasiliensis]